MKESDLEKKYGLEKTHSIAKSDDYLKFFQTNKTELTDDPSVYVWTAKKKKSDEIIVLYVGKAGYGLNRRFSQHTGGFKHNITGKKNKEALSEYLEKGYEINVYSRISSLSDIFNTGSKVSLYASEEEALCLNLNPLPNRAKSPSSPSTDNFKNQILTTVSKQLFGYTEQQIEEISSYLDSLDNKTLELLKDTIVILNVLFKENYCKLVGKYTKQPEGCSNTPTLTFSNEKSLKLKNWNFRIYLNEYPRIGFPMKYLNETVNIGLIDSSKDKVFSPKSTDHFIKNHINYIDIEK